LAAAFIHWPRVPAGHADSASLSPAAGSGDQIQPSGPMLFAAMLKANVPDLEMPSTAMAFMQADFYPMGFLLALGRNRFIDGFATLVFCKSPASKPKRPKMSKPTPNRPPKKRTSAALVKVPAIVDASLIY